MKFRPRIVLSAAIVAFWLFMVGSLLYRYVFTRVPVPADTTSIEASSLAMDQVQYEEWMELKSNNMAIGVFHTSLLPDEEGERRYRGDMDLIVDLGGVVPNFSIRAMVFLDSILTLQKLHVVASLMNVEWSITGIVHNKELLYSMKRGDESYAGKMGVKGQTTLLDSANSLIGRKFNLIPGESYRISVFDPVWNFSAGDVIITVVGSEDITVDDSTFQTYKIATHMGKFQSFSWVTREGDTIKRKIGDNLEMIRVSPEEARMRFPELADELTMPMLEYDEVLRQISEQKKGVTFQPLSLLSRLIKEQQ